MTRKQTDERMKMVTFPVILAAVALWFVSFLLMPMDADVKMYVPPSEMFLHEAFSCKYWFYRHRPAPDFLILGNSRTDAALDPDIVSAEFQRKCGRPVTVASFSSGGGYFPFYQEILTTLIDRKQLPRNVILGISPRDFNRLENRRYSVAECLRASSGYNLKRIPYAEPFHTIEGKLADVTALLFPGFFCSDHLGKRFFRTRESVPDIQILCNYPRIQAVLNKWYKDAVTMAPRMSGFLDGSGIGFGARMKYYLGRFRTVRGWNPEVTGMIGPSGGNIGNVDYSVFAQRKKDAMAKQRALWNPDQTGSPYLNYRYDKEFKKGIDLWDDPSGAPERTLKFLAEHKVGVYIVILPAYVLEGWENNLRFNEVLKKHLLGLRDRYPNVRQIIDINNNFNNPFLDPDLYYDAEHATPEAAKTFSQYVVNMMNLHECPGGGLGSGNDDVYW